MDFQESGKTVVKKPEEYEQPHINHTDVYSTAMARVEVKVDNYSIDYFSMNREQKHEGVVYSWVIEGTVLNK